MRRVTYPVTALKHVVVVVEVVIAVIAVLVTIVVRLVIFQEIVLNRVKVGEEEEGAEEDVVVVLVTLVVRQVIFQGIALIHQSLVQVVVVLVVVMILAHATTAVKLAISHVIVQVVIKEESQMNAISVVDKDILPEIAQRIVERKTMSVKNESFKQFMKPLL